MTKIKRQIWLRQPSWWLVVVAGTLLIVFLVAIVRELINGHLVRQQVADLRRQVTTEQQRQQQLKDLIDYLNSPTFQEQEARLKLGLKKSDERVVIIPPTNGDDKADSLSASSPSQGTEKSRPARWWDYFFAPKKVNT